MALEKNNIAINFSQGLDLQTDPFQVAPGRFLTLVNTVFQNGTLQKRNGFGNLASLPDASNIYCTTFNDNLTAVGSSFYAYSAGSDSWINKGIFNSVKLEVMPLVRSNTNQTQGDSVVSPNGLVCTAFTDTLSSTTAYKYVIAVSATGQNIVAPTLIAPSGGSVTGSPRVFLLGNNFIIVFTATISAVDHLQYIAINIYQPTNVTTAVDISNAYTSVSTVSWDGVVANNSLYISWNGNDAGGAIRTSYIDSTLVQHPTVVVANFAGALFSLCADQTGSTPIIYVNFYSSVDHKLYTIAYSQILEQFYFILDTTTTGVVNIASAAQNGLLTLFYEITTAYSYDSGVPTNRIVYRTVPFLTFTPSSEIPLIRSLGLSTKAFIVNGVIYVMGVYFSLYQPTYFLIDSSSHIIMKLAYSNAGGYVLAGLPSVTILNQTALFAYFFKDLIIPVNKTQGASVSQVYAQTGINLAMVTFNSSDIISSEIGGNLNLSGGYLLGYDGNVAVESGFHLYPDNVEATTATTGGTILAGEYFYQAIYEWTDAQGNIFRSAPSIPTSVTTTGTTSTNTVNVPTLRVTSKTQNPVKIVIFRASVSQPTYYQVTSIIAPLMNSTTADSVAYTDKAPDSSIIGNSIIYTTGGVVENIGAPATSNMALFKSRLVLIDSEDRNLLWYSKQVIEATPVEMSDLFTIYVAPTTAAQGPTGPMTSLSAMDDKLIIFKRNCIYYITGTGPDITGVNDDFSDPIFITSTVGCTNQQSIVFSPAGLMFQSDKGIWILKRDLSTSYIGAPVEDFNDVPVLSALNIPGTNEVRFTLSNGLTLMYNYYYNQWGVFEGAPGISATLYENLHTIIDQFGRVSRETIGKYLDGAAPVLMSFTTSWMNLMGLQGYERAYFFYMLGTYISPHKLQVQVAYDYAASPEQSVMISPDNFSPAYGGDPLYGNGSPYGGPGSLEQWRIFFSKQKCQSFQISMQEIYDPSFGVAAGAGLIVSGLNITIGGKKKYPTIKTANTVG